MKVLRLSGGSRQFFINETDYITLEPGLKVASNIAYAFPSPGAE